MDDMAIPILSTDAAQLAVQLAKAQHQTCILVYTDIRAAYYSCINEVALGRILSAEGWRQLFNMCGLFDEDRELLTQMVENEDIAMRRQGVHKAWREAARDWHTKVSFTVSTAGTGKLPCRGRDQEIQ